MVHWQTEKLGTISGPVERRARWHQFLANFNFEIGYIEDELNTVADILSRWAYGAYQSNPEVSLHGNLSDTQPANEAERETLEWAKMVRVLRGDQALTSSGASVLPSAPFSYLKPPDVNSEIGSLNKTDLLYIARLENLVTKGTKQCISEHISQGLGRVKPTAAVKKISADLYIADYSTEVHSTLSRSYPDHPVFGGLLRPLNYRESPLTVLYENWDKAYEQDKSLAPIIEKCIAGRFHKEERPGDYTYSQGRLWTGAGKICVPSTLRESVVKAIHNHAQPGVAKTVALLDRKYDFDLRVRDLDSLVKKVVEKCETCAQAKERTGPGPVSPPPILFLPPPLNTYN